MPAQRWSRRCRELRALSKERPLVERLGRLLPLVRFDRLLNFPFYGLKVEARRRLHWRELDGRLRQFGNLLLNEHEPPKLAGNEIVHVRIISANPIKLRSIAAAETTKPRSRISMQGSLQVR